VVVVVGEEKEVEEEGEEALECCYLTSLSPGSIRSTLASFSLRFARLREELACRVKRG